VDAAEAAERRLRRLRIRSWRRGIREMDLVLGGFADRRLAELDVGALVAFESLLSENDHDLYQWIAGGGSIPQRFEGIILEIRRHHGL
jgi:antitoxin CptB